MSNFLAVLATLKAIFVVAAVRFAAGDGLAVILISLLLNLAQLGGKSLGQMAPKDTVSPNRAADFRAAADFEKHAANPKAT
jgi:hypothetical protein